MLVEDIEIPVDRNTPKQEIEELEAMARDTSVRCGVDIDKNDVFVYRVTAKKFGTERDSDVGADGIRRPRIEELER